MKILFFDDYKLGLLKGDTHTWVRDTRHEMEQKGITGRPKQLSGKLRIPRHSDHRFHGIPITHSTAKRSVIPRQFDH